MTVRSVARRVGRALVAIALVAVVGVFVVQAVPGLVGAESSYVVLSNSMAPAIEPGDSVIVGDVTPEDVEVGDVITFEREADQPPVTHRVREVIRGEDGLAFRTAGDNNEDPDPGTVPAEAVIGEVWFAIPMVGHVVQFANRPAGAAVIIGLPVALLAFSELWARGDGATVSAGDRDATDEGANAGTPRADGDGPAAADGDQADGGITVGANELRLGALGFGTFAAYAAYVAYGDPSGLTVGVAVGATVAAALHLVPLAVLATADGAGAEPADADRPLAGVVDHSDGEADD